MKHCQATLFLLLFLLSTSSVLADSSSSSSSSSSSTTTTDPTDHDSSILKSPSDKCFVEDSCKLCPDNYDPFENPECREHNKHRPYTCIGSTVPDSTGTTIAKSYTQFRSCKHTPGDEQIGFLILLVVCFVVGAAAMFGANNENRKHSSIFDKRKRGEYTPIRVKPINKNGSRDRTGEEESVSFLVNRNDEGERFRGIEMTGV